MSEKKEPCSAAEFATSARVVIGLDKKIVELCARRAAIEAEIESAKKLRASAVHSLAFDAMPDYGTRLVLVDGMVVTVSWGHSAWPSFEAVPVEVP